MRLSVSFDCTTCSTAGAWLNFVREGKPDVIAVLQKRARMTAELKGYFGAFPPIASVFRWHTCRYERRTTRRRLAMVPPAREPPSLIPSPQPKRDFGLGEQQKLWERVGASRVRNEFVAALGVDAHLTHGELSSQAENLRIGDERA